MFSIEATPLLDKVESCSLQDLWSEHPNQRGKPETRNILPRGCKLGDGKCNVLQNTGTNGQDENIVYKEALKS
jgi:hypothetical protein